MPAEREAQPGAPLLEARGVALAFGGLRAVDGMDLDVREAEVVGLIGPNGAGKTTFFNVLAGVHRPDDGRVTFAGQDITGLPAHKVARLGLARTFQITRALARMSVLDNVCLAAPDQRGEALLPALLQGWRAQEREVQREAREALAFVGLVGKEEDYAGTLSGGQRKLLELARALMLKPRLLLLDEPLAGVNPTLAVAVLERILALRRERGIACLLIEHDLQAVLRSCDRVLVMAQGRRLAEGTPEQVRHDPRVLEAYLGGVTASAEDATEAGA